MTLLIPVILAQMLASPAPSDSPARPARGAVETLRADLDGDHLDDTLRLEQRRTGVYLVLEMSNGRKIEKGLGIEPLTFSLDGVSSRLALRDIDGDGAPEILVGAAVGDRGLLFVLSWDPSADVSPLRSLRSGDESFAADRGAGADAIRISSKGVIDVATLRSAKNGTRITRDQFEWSADAHDFVWSDSVASATATPFAGFRSE